MDNKYYVKCMEEFKTPLELVNLVNELTEKCNQLEKDIKTSELLRMQYSKTQHELLHEIYRLRRECSCMELALESAQESNIKLTRQVAKLSFELMRK